MKTNENTVTERKACADVLRLIRAHRRLIQNARHLRQDGQGWIGQGRPSSDTQSCLKWPFALK